MAVGGSSGSSPERKGGASRQASHFAGMPVPLGDGAEFWIEKPSRQSDEGYGMKAMILIHKTPSVALFVTIF